MKSSHKKNKSVGYPGSGMHTPNTSNYPDTNPESKSSFSNQPGAFQEYLKIHGHSKEAVD